MILPLMMIETLKKGTGCERTVLMNSWWGECHWVNAIEVSFERVKLL